jgi:hypothetical protein
MIYTVKHVLLIGIMAVFAAVEVEQVNQVKMFVRMFQERSIEDMQQKS